MLDASLSEEEARRLLARLLEQGIASCGVVCMGYAFFCSNATDYYRRYWRTDHQLYKVLVTILLVVFSLYTIILLVQTILLARSVVEDPTLTINSLPIWFSWLHVTLRALLMFPGALCEAFFLLRASKATTSRFLKLLVMVIFNIAGPAWIISLVLISLEVRRSDQPWSHRVSIAECISAAMALATNLSTALVLVHEILQGRTIRIRPAHDVLRAWYQGAIKTSLVVSIATGGLFITSCFFYNHLAAITFNFWIHLYASLVTVSTVYALNSRERIKREAHSSTSHAYPHPETRPKSDGMLGYSLRPSLVSRSSAQRIEVDVQVETFEEECEMEEDPRESARERRRKTMRERKEMEEEKLTRVDVDEVVV